MVRDIVECTAGKLIKNDLIVLPFQFNMLHLKTYL